MRHLASGIRHPVSSPPQSHKIPNHSHQTYNHERVKNVIAGSHVITKKQPAQIDSTGHIDHQPKQSHGERLAHLYE